MIAEGSCGNEDFAITGIKYILKWKEIENSYLKL